MKDDAMKHALQRRKGHGIELTILVAPKDESDVKGGELAPEPEEEGQQMMDQKLMGPSKIEDEMMAMHQGEDNMSTLKGKVNAMMQKKRK